MDKSNIASIESSEDCFATQEDAPLTNDQAEVLEVATTPVNHSTSNTAVSSAINGGLNGTKLHGDEAQSGLFAGLNLSQDVLEHLLNEFRSRQAFYPFIVIRPEWTVRFMTIQRPFLLLATVTGASSRYPQLQQVLVTRLKETLARRIVIEGERDLDLLQGLLVHLAW